MPPLQRRHRSGGRVARRGTSPRSRGTRDAGRACPPHSSRAAGRQEGAPRSSRPGKVRHAISPGRAPPRPRLVPINAARSVKAGGGVILLRRRSNALEEGREMNFFATMPKFGYQIGIAFEIVPYALLVHLRNPIQRSIISRPFVGSRSV